MSRPYISKGLFQYFASALCKPAPRLMTHDTAAVVIIDISGFTRASEILCTDNSLGGVEALSSLLNYCFGAITDIVDHFGGDVIRFAGDALICAWMSRLNDAVLQNIITCCIRVCETFSSPEFAQEWENIEISVHIGASCGCINEYHVGGFQGRYEVLLSGNALKDASRALDVSQKGQFCFPATLNGLFAEMKDIVVETDPCIEDGNIFVLKGAFTASKHEPLSKMGTSRVSRAEEPPSPSLILEVEDSDPRSAVINASLCSFIHLPILHAFHSMERPSAEIRTVTTSFLSVDFYGDNFEYSLRRDGSSGYPGLQAIFQQLQKCVAHYDGMVRQFIIDDKGCVFISCWGVIHSNMGYTENNETLAISAALHCKCTPIECYSLSIFVIPFKSFSTSSLIILLRQIHRRSQAHEEWMYGQLRNCNGKDLLWISGVRYSLRICNGGRFC